MIKENAERLSSDQALAGKMALVTGGTRGIGRAIALKLARAGSDVAIVYHNSHDEAESVCAEVHGARS
jgi:enoyl-[acyl-carrier protein] reductase III